MNKRKICIVTGTRAEYGLFYFLMKEIQNDSSLELQVVVTGMHLSPEFGLTYKNIENDGFKINKKIEMLLSSDTPVSIAKSMGLGLIGFADCLDEIHPDIVVALGDRYETLAAVIATLFLKIPVAHIHGGEITEGAFDESIRHSITKMSHLHFTSTDEYKKRVTQLGEFPETVFNVGSLGVENIEKLNLLSREELEKKISFIFGKKNLLITFHPVTLEFNSAKNQFQSLLDALEEEEDTKFIFTKPNSDTDGRIIIQMIDEYVFKNSHKAISFTSMGQLNYLSAMQFVDAVVGNSSSGIIEAPSFKKPTVNIGDRQKGRIKANSVLDCEPNKESISSALKKIYLEEFISISRSVSNPYKQIGTAKKIKDILKSINLDFILKKKFFDIPFTI
jgi:GDP/UDP-N,N'-diacetylbacillosamine 2-epimerase (hydrolysing)